MPGLDWALLGPALVAGWLVVLTHVPLGREVLRRGIIFLDLAIAQMAALGALAAVSVGFAAHSLVVQACSFVAGLLGALLLQWTDHKWAQEQEAVIGTLFVLSASAALLLLANHPHGSEAMREILAGQILWVSYDQILLGALIYAIALPVLLSRQLFRPFVFYPLFSLCVTVSVQWVGVYLVFATLIIPALATRGDGGNQCEQRTGFGKGCGIDRWRLAWAYAIGAVGYASGLALSLPLDWPAGPLIVWCLLVVAVIWRLGFRRCCSRGR